LKSHFQIELIEAGCDEAGRGCLAGPVFAAAVILPLGFYHPLLNDSKQVTEKNRFILRSYIEEQAIAFAVKSVDHKTIDKINILKASIKAMQLAVDNLSTTAQLLLIDGNRFTPHRNIAHKCFIKGDSLYASIAAASILAKTYRDEYMLKQHKKHPQYNWQKNKGYGTLEHRMAMNTYGLSPLHRKSFHLKENSLIK
jgi:ribonuclease HII